MKFNDTWFGMEGMEDDKPFLIRGRENIQPLKETQRYQHRIDIVWTYQSEDDSEMPSQPDLDLMEKVENSLVEYLEHDLQSILAFVLTGKGKRVWHWYATDLREANIRINDSLMDFEQLPIELFSELDPDWQTYNNILD